MLQSVKSRANKYKIINFMLAVWIVLLASNMFYVYALLIFIISVVFLFFKKRYAYWEERDVPFPKPTYVFGNTGKAIAMTKLMSRILNDLYNDYDDCTYVGLFNFWTPAVLVRDIDLIKDVLIKQFNNFHDNWTSVSPAVDPIMAKNPFVMRSDEWKTVRTQLTPQYTGAKVKAMIPLMQTVTKHLVKYINDQTATRNSNCFEVKELVGRYTGENVLTCAYGLEGKSFTEEVPVAFKIGNEIASASLLVQIKQTIGVFFPLLRRLLNVTFIGSPIPRVFWDMILDTIQYRNDHDIVRRDYLEFIRDLQKSKVSPYEVTDAYAVAHAFTFFLDSFETSGIAMTFILYELSLNPDVQTKSRMEIDNVLQKYNGSLTHEALQELIYVDNVISESLRKHPIILFLSRICTEEYKFPAPKGMGKDVVIEKGTQIFIPVYGVHHDPQYYPDPDRFDPDRFTEEIRSTRPKSCFLGFGDGPRICLGTNYAITQIKVALVAILSEFELRMNEKTTVPYERDLLQILNVPKDGIFVDFHKRS